MLTVKVSEDVYLTVVRVTYYAGWCRLYTSEGLAAVLDGREATELRVQLERQAIDPVAVGAAKRERRDNQAA